MKKEFTHYAFIIGNDARTPDSFRCKVKLRETKTMWITQNGRRFNKKYLTNPGEQWPLYRLESTPCLINDSF